jgi:hypothetical protein
MRPVVAVGRSGCWYVWCDGVVVGLVVSRLPSQTGTDEALRDVSGVRSSNSYGRMPDGETEAANLPTVFYPHN